MKKARNILFGLLLIAALTLNVSAAGSSVSLEPSAKTLYRGDTFTVVANLSNSEDINMGTVLLSYDESALEMTDGICHVEHTTIGQVIPGKKVGTFFLLKATAVSGKVFTFTFRVKDNAALGDYEITVKASTGTAGGNYIDATGTTVTVACKHDSTKDWSVDQSQHWKVCSKCEDKVNISDHTQEQPCAVCGYKGATIPGEEAIPQNTITATQQETTNPQDAAASTQPKNPSEPTLSQDAAEPTVLTTDTILLPDLTEEDVAEEKNVLQKDPALWWIIAIMVVVVGGAAAGLIIIRKRKKG